MNVWPNREDFALDITLSSDNSFDGIEEREARAGRYKKYKRQKFYAIIWLLFLIWLLFFMFPVFVVDLFAGNLTLIEFGIGVLILITANMWIAIIELWIVSPGNTIKVIKMVNAGKQR